MTWAFVYLVGIIIGLVLAGSTGLLRTLPFMASHRHLVVPLPEQHFSHLNVLGRRIGLMLLVFGAVGLALQGWNRLETRHNLVIAVLAALGAAALAFVLVRRRCATARSSDVAVAIKDIPPGGYGQVRLGTEPGAPVVAARNLDERPIPAGSHVEVVDCTRSVISISRAGTDPVR